MTSVPKPRAASKTLAIASGKGGVGKTTIALNLSLAMAKRGRRTLLIDTDPLGAVGASVDGAAMAGKGLVPWVFGRSGFEEAILGTGVEGFDLLVYGGTEANAAASGRAAPLEFRVEETMAAIGRAAELYDLVVVDTPAGFGPTSREAVATCQYVLVPLQAEPLALRGVPGYLEYLAALRSGKATSGGGSAIAGFVLSQVDSRSEVSLAVSQESWNRVPGDLVLDAYVPRDATFLRASAEGVPVALLGDPPPAVAAVFDRITAELEPRLGWQDG